VRNLQKLLLQIYHADIKKTILGKGQDCLKLKDYFLPRRCRRSATTSKGLAMKIEE
jgi:hypothetical protein